MTREIREVVRNSDASLIKSSLSALAIASWSSRSQTRSEASLRLSMASDVDILRGDVGFM